MSHDNDVLETVREFVQREIKPIASEIDDKMQIPSSLLEKMSSLNLFGMLTPENFGGVGMTFSSFLRVIEEFSRYSPSTALVLGTHNALALWLIDRFGSQVQRTSFLSDMSHGKKIGSVSVGSNGSFLNTDGLNLYAAKSTTDSYTIRGSNSAILNGSYGNIFVVFCKLESGIGIAILERDGSSDTLKVETRNLLGLKGGGISSIQILEHPIRADHLLETSHNSSGILDAIQENFFLMMSAISIGITRGSMDQSVQYSNQRIQFGQPISKFEAIQDLIGEMAIGYESSSHLLRNLSSMKDTGEEVDTRVVISRILSSRVATLSSRSAQKIHGGYGFTEDYSIDRLVRDAQTIKILGGATHDLLMSVGKRVTDGYSF